MLMYNKDYKDGVLVSQSQVKTLEKAGWSKTPIKPEKIIEQAVKVQQKADEKTAEAIVKDKVNAVKDAPKIAPTPTIVKK